jgi:hypothetical protein
MTATIKQAINIAADIMTIIPVWDLLHYILA